MFKRLGNIENKLFKVINSDLKCLPFTDFFNPSVRFSDCDNYHLAIRFFNDANSLLECGVLIKKNGEITFINLSKEFSYLNIPKVADPKIFYLEGRCWLTFNTGHTKDANNDIFLVCLEDEKLNPIKVIYIHRSKIEKNWCFYVEKDYLYALYSIQPLVILKSKCKFSELAGKSEISFDNLIERKNDNDKLNGLSIGTQLAHYKGKYYLMAHRKIYFLSKRLYLGVLLELDFEKLRVRNLTGKYFIHSFVKLLGERKKLNKNLISCTYFSGLDINNNNVIFSYGINDLAYNICALKVDEIIK